MPLLLLLPIFHFALVFAYQSTPPSARHKLSRGTLHWFLHIKVPIPFVVFCCKNRLFILHWFLHIKVLPGCETPTRLVALCYVFCISKCASGFFFCRMFRKRRNPANVFQVGWRKLWWGLIFWVPLWREVSTSVIGSHFLNSLADKFPEKRASVFENGVSKIVVGFYFLNSPAASQRPY